MDESERLQWRRKLDQIPEGLMTAREAIVHLELSDSEVERTMPELLAYAHRVKFRVNFDASVEISPADKIDSRKIPWHYRYDPSAMTAEDLAKQHNARVSEEMESARTQITDLLSEYFEDPNASSTVMKKILESAKKAIKEAEYGRKRDLLYDFFNVHGIDTKLDTFSSGPPLENPNMPLKPNEDEWHSLFGDRSLWPGGYGGFVLGKRILIEAPDGGLFVARLVTDNRTFNRTDSLVELRLDEGETTIADGEVITTPGIFERLRRWLPGG